MKTIYRLLAGFLGLVFTVAGCSDDDATEYGPPTQVEYGVPRADFRISGQVIDEVSGQGVPGFEVTFSDDLADTTDAQGFWRIEGESFPCGQECSVQLQDIDGPANGSYPPHVEPLDLVQTAPGDGRWYDGRFEQHDLLTSLVAMRKRAGVE